MTKIEESRITFWMSDIGYAVVIPHDSIEERRAGVLVFRMVASNGAAMIVDDLDKPVSSPSQEEAVIVGTLRSDRCSDFNFKPMHFCEKEEAMKLGVLMERVYDIASNLIPLWEE